MDELVWVGDEVPGGPNRHNQEYRYDLLAARPGEWAEWWGKSQKNVHAAVRHVRRGEYRIEAVYRHGKAYVRAVKAE